MKTTLLKKLLIVFAIVSISTHSFAQVSTTITSDATHINLVGDLLKSDGSGGYVAASTVLVGVTDVALPVNCGISIKNGSSAVFFRNFKSDEAKLYGPSLIENDTPSTGFTTATWDTPSEISNIPISTNVSAVPPVADDVLDWTFIVNATSNSINLTVVDFTLGIEDYQKLEGVNIYPNPTSDVLKITCPQGSNVDFYSLIGVKVKSIEKASRDFNMEVSDLATGLYIVKVENEGKFYSKKLQIK